MAQPKKRPPRKRAAKKAPNSKITEAQQAASEKRIAGKANTDTLRGQSGAEAARLAQPGLPPTQLEPRTTTPMAGAGRGVDQESIAARDNTAGKSMSDAANKITGLAAPVIAQMQANAPKNPIADPNLFGVSTAKRASNLTAVLEALKGQAQVQLKTAGKAVYMGPQKAGAKIRNSGPDRFNADGSTTTQQDVGDVTTSKEELLSWLSDDAKVNEIKAAAQKAGLNVQSYDDVAKLWGSVVDQAASTYSLGGKKVTPWALIQLRGKHVGPDGRMQDRVTVSTNIDEMAPETARKMFETTAQQALGRAPTKAEIDDFIAKAQTIAHDNPGVTTTHQKVGFDGNVEKDTQVSHTVGGGQAVTDKAEMAALDQARQSEDYASYQAAGNYFPMLFQALQAPV